MAGRYSSDLQKKFSKGGIGMSTAFRLTPLSYWATAPVMAHSTLELQLAVSLLL